MTNQKTDRIGDLCRRTKEVFGALYFIFFVIRCVGLSSAIIGQVRDQSYLYTAYALVTALFIFPTILLFVSGMGLWQGKRWGMRLAVIVNVTLILEPLYISLLTGRPTNQIDWTIMSGLAVLTAVLIICLTKSKTPGSRDSLMTPEVTSNKERTNQQTNKIGRFCRSIKEVLGILYLLLFVFQFGLLVMAIIAQAEDCSYIYTSVVLVDVLLLINTVLLLISGIALWQGKRWGMRLAIIVNVTIMIMSPYSDLLFGLHMGSADWVFLAALAILTVVLVLCLVKQRAPVDL